MGVGDAVGLGDVTPGRPSLGMQNVNCAGNREPCPGGQARGVDGAAVRRDAGGAVESKIKSVRNDAKMIVTHVGLPGQSGGQWILAIIHHSGRRRRIAESYSDRGRSKH